MFDVIRNTDVKLFNNIPTWLKSTMFAYCYAMECTESVELDDFEWIATVISIYIWIDDIWIVRKNIFKLMQLWYIKMWTKTWIWAYIYIDMKGNE